MTGEFAHFSADEFLGDAEARGTTEIPSGLYRYNQAARRLQEAHTGSVDVYLSIEAEQQLATVIEASATAQQGIEALAETDSAAAEQESQRYSRLFDAAQAAKQKLVESNLRFAAYYARASMNIWTPKKKSKELEAQTSEAKEVIMADVPDISRERGGGNKPPGAFSDIRKLRSPFASLEDRTQVANAALVEAAHTFRPMRDKNDKPVTFLSYAGYRVHSALSKYAKTDEMPGWYVAQTTVDQIYKSQRYPEEYTPEKRKELERADLGRNVVSLDDIHIATQEDWDAPWPLDDEAIEAADIIGYAESEELLQSFFDDEASRLIQDMLDCLSEREKTVVVLRFGLYDTPQSNLEEIGRVLGVTRERVRQIESKAMGKLRHRASVNEKLTGLIAYAASEQNPSLSASTVPTVDGAPNIKLGRIMGREATRQFTLSAPEVAVESEKEIKDSWQAYPGEAWDAPLRRSPQEMQQDYEHTLTELTRLLFRAAPYTFQRSFAEDVGSPYPKALVTTIEESLDKSLTSSHIEDFWNMHIEAFTDALSNKLGDDFDLDRVSTLFSKLLADHMRDESSVGLTIPESLYGLLNNLGEGLQNGKLSITGNVGDFLGYQAGGLANIELHGSAGDYAGVGMKDYASLEISGDAGNFAGGEMQKSAHLIVRGSVKDNCGEDMSGAGAIIDVEGDAGFDVGHGAKQGTIHIRGTASSVAMRRGFKGEIIARRVVEVRSI